MNRKLLLISVIFFSLAITCLANFGLAPERYQNSKQIIVKYYLSTTDPAEHLAKLNIPFVKIERVLKTQPLVERYKKNRKFRATPSGEYQFNETVYKTVADIPEEEILKEAIKTMPEEAKGLYRTYRITLEDNKDLVRYLLWLNQSTKVEFAKMDNINSIV